MFERFIARARLVSSFPFELFSSFFIEDEKKKQNKQKDEDEPGEEEKEDEEEVENLVPSGHH